MFYLKRKKKAIEALENAETTYKNLGTLANNEAIALYNLRKGCSVAINNVEAYLALLSNSPLNYKKEVASVQVCIKDFNEAVKIEKEYSSGQTIEAVISGACLNGSSAIDAIGPIAAMTIATTFGKESTRSAIASLSVAGAINTASALGVGAAMATGQAFLSIVGGPVAWGLFGVDRGLSFIRKTKKDAEEAEQALCNVKPILADLECKLQELRNLYTETDKLLPSICISTMCNGFPKDYDEFTEDQKLRLGALINSTKAMGVLINKRIS